MDRGRRLQPGRLRSLKWSAAGAPAAERGRGRACRQPHERRRRDRRTPAVRDGRWSELRARHGLRHRLQRAMTYASMTIVVGKSSTGNRSRAAGPWSAQQGRDGRW